MSDKEYGLEDLCESLDGIELQLRKLVGLKKLELKCAYGESVEVDNI